MLADEFGTASNIKSRVNRLSVLGAITSVQHRLKLYTKGNLSFVRILIFLLLRPFFLSSLNFNLKYIMRGKRDSFFPFLIVATTGRTLQTILFEL